MFDKVMLRLGRAPERYPKALVAPDRDEGKGGEGGEGVLSSWWTTGVGAVLALAGAAGAVWGLVQLGGALSADNRSNPLREIGVVMAVGATALGAIVLLSGAGLVWAAARRRRARGPRPRRP
ncbi:hypothetical protein FHX52_4683 [Humibacillus xanthopallidus]|uniref:Uncharacterized protein n=1 Tax=Humibacillus xanthopallidus TaxID=412689 RepID=A0A543PMZ5_9MICO|nr:hypothetical protein [Humibacillus xanthopallidus]TQN45443.1 hypothetical protein FHX52_4683 [Humibacillus xanthopallidus]